MKICAPLFLIFLLFASCNRGTGRAGQSLFAESLSSLSQKVCGTAAGSHTPEGWLLQQLELMRDGMTGHLDEWYPSVVGERNGWLGGDGDGWERGVYWLDGLVPLAWLLEDDALKEKAMPWIEWTLGSQTESGYFGPVPFEEPPLSGTRTSKGYAAGLVAQRW